ncbi:MAG: transcription-repair coupling factor, partial [Oscillospiraceae bacterium]|nr:transcription-repair coupling factor [Oscillospiraceae bacterium]
MDTLIRAVREEPTVEKLLAAVDAGACPAVVSGLGGVHFAVVASALYAHIAAPVFIICHDEQAAARMAADVSALTGREAMKLFSRDFVFESVDGASRAGEQARLAALWALKRGRAPIVCASVDGVMQRTLPPEALERYAFAIDEAETYDLTELTERLAQAGYVRTEQVEGAGQYAVRGGILDVFSPAHEKPVRCEFFGDEIDSMGFFDVSTQRRTEMAKKAIVLPALEALVSAAGGPDALADKLAGAHEKLLRRKGAREEQRACLMR